MGTSRCEKSKYKVQNVCIKLFGKCVKELSILESTVVPQTTGPWLTTKQLH